MEKLTNASLSNEKLDQMLDTLDIVELDERLELAADPLLSFSDTCCSNATNCGC